jgi:GAF domain-containing protein
MDDPARSHSDRAAPRFRLVTPDGETRVGAPGDDVESYRRLADVFHDVLSEQSLDSLLVRIADTLAELVPYEALHIYEADEAKRELNPALVRSDWSKEILDDTFPFGVGITGWAVEHREPVLSNQAHLDPRVAFVPGTPVDPEALIVVPLVARGLLKGTLNVYRIGEDARFSDQEFELAKRFGDAAALALDNAHVRARLEREAQTDSLTGLFNHRYFHERLRRELTLASSSHESVALVMMDIDDFKKVNDVYGHGVGDLVLAALADQLRAAVRSTDVVCRIGGEEFAVIVPAGSPSGSRRPSSTSPGGSPSRSGSRTAPTTPRTGASSSRARRRR